MEDCGGGWQQLLVLFQKLNVFMEIQRLLHPVCHLEPLQREGQRKSALGFGDFSCDALPLPHPVSVKFKELKHHEIFNTEIKPNLPPERF